MSLYDVRRQRRSSVRSNDDADSGEVAVASPGQRDERPGSAAADARRAPGRRPPARGSASRPPSSVGTAAPDGATLPSSSRANSSRASAESRLSHEPAHHTTAWCLRARQRDVREAQVLAALLVDVLLPVRASTAALRGRRRSSAVAGRRRGRHRLASRSGCSDGSHRNGAVDDRELEALAAVDRQHLHGLGVGLEPAAALLVARCRSSPRRSVRAATRSARWRRAARSSPRRAAARRRGAGRSAAARRRPARARAPAAPRSSVIVSVSDATPCARSTARPVVQAAVDLLPRVVVRGGDLARRPAEERGQRRRARARRRRRGARAPPAAAATRARARCRTRCRRR